MPTDGRVTSKKKSASQIADIANLLIDPILAKKAGINTMLLNAWDEIVGPEFKDSTRPDKIVWPPSNQKMRDEIETGGGLEPGTLTIACEGARALFLSHQQNEVIARINSFLGFPAISRIKIVQKSISQANKQRKKTKGLSVSEQTKLDLLVANIEDDKLTKALKKLGRAVLSQSRT